MVTVWWLFGGCLKLELIVLIVGMYFNCLSVLAQSPSPPRHVQAVGNKDGVSIYWNTPTTEESYITEYTIQYFIPPDPGATVKVGPEVRNYSIVDHQHAGRLFIVRMFAFTAGGSSNSTDPVYVRSSKFIPYFPLFSKQTNQPIQLIWFETPVI